MHISRWLDENPTRNATSKNTATRYAKRVFNWAKKEGRLEANPIQLAEAPSPKRREHANTPEQHELVMSFIRDLTNRDQLASKVIHFKLTSISLLSELGTAQYCCSGVYLA